MKQLNKERLEFYANNEPPYGYTGSDIQEMARRLLAAEAQKPVAWRYRHVMPHMKNADGSMGWVMPWKYVGTEEECNTSPDYQREALYAAPQVAQPVQVPDEIPAGLAGTIISLCAYNVRDKELAQKIWNACRAAMLSAPQPDGDNWVAFYDTTAQQYQALSTSNGKRG